VRFVGITGHREPDVMIEALRRYSFHTALIPVNAADKHHPRPYFPGVLEVAQKQNVGVIAMKVPAYGKLFQAGGLTSMLQAFNYSLSQPGVHCCIISADNVKQLEENAWIASIFRQLNDTELAAIKNALPKFGRTPHSTALGVSIADRIKRTFSSTVLTALSNDQPQIAGWHCP
jgi:predicted aldo/keto reductase-like oxidoreductase